MSESTEREKMLTGEFYNPRDVELLEMYHVARKLLFELNHWIPEMLSDEIKL